jgi:hypothetical protein
MKFNDLYNRVFVAEQELPSDAEDVAQPSDVDVEGLPLATDNGGAAPTIGGGGSGPSDLMGYLKQIEEFTNKLNGVEGNSLQSLAVTLSKPGTPFEGAADRLAGNIESAAKSLGDLSATLRRLVGGIAKQ